MENNKELYNSKRVFPFGQHNSHKSIHACHNVMLYVIQQTDWTNISL